MGNEAATHKSSPAESIEHEPQPEMSQRRVLGLALPIIGENLLQTLVGVVDTLFVAAIGATALAGVGIASEIVFFLIAILSSIAMGGTVVVSRAIGAREPAEANRLARQTVVWGLVIAVPLSLVSYLLAPVILGIFQTTPEVAAEATTYLRITGGDISVMLLTFVFGAVLRGAGDGQTPLRASLVANVVNAGLSYVLIFGELGFPRLEVAGSAWGSIIGRGTGALILFWFLYSGRRAVSIAGRVGWKPDLTSARSLMQIGVPTAMERMLTNAGITTLVAIVALIGTSALAAQQIIFTAFAVAMLPGMGFAIAATALTGQSYGARDLTSASAATAIALRWALIGMASSGAIYFLLARPILGVFTDNANVIDQGDGALRALALSLPMWAFQSVYGGSLRALGDARTPMITNVIATWLAVALAWVGVRWFGGNLTFIWTAFVITSPIMLVNVFIFRRRLASAEQALDSDAPSPAPS